MHRCLAVPVPTFRLQDSLSECYITGRCLPAMTPRVLVMGDEVRTEENFFRRTITINSFTGRRWSIRSDGGQHLPSPRHFSSAEAEANGLLEELYPRTLGRFGGNGLFHNGSANAQRVDDLLCAVLHPLGESPSEVGRIHAVPGPGVDRAAGAKHEYGGVGKPVGLLLSGARPRCEVLPIFRERIKTGSVNPLRLPARSPNLNSYAERWVKSVKEECLSRLILFGESSLRRALKQYLEHNHGKRSHQGKGNRILFPSQTEARRNMGAVRCRERLGGLLKYNEREAA